MDYYAFYSLSALASKYPDGVESAPELPDLMNMVAAHIPTRWRDVGIQLKINPDVLDSIDITASSNSSRCFQSMFTLWKKKMTTPYKWSTLIDALQTPAVGELKLAEELKNMLK